MKENEFQRRQREREFQRRVLAALEKPPGNRFWAVLNSGIVIWLLSTSVIVLGGGYITSHLQCLKDANQLIDKREIVLSEYNSLIQKYRDAIEKSTSSKDLASALIIKEPSDNGLSNLSLGELGNEFLKADSRTSYDEIPDKAVDNTRMDWLKFANDATDKQFDKAANNTLYGISPGENNLNAFRSDKLVDLYNAEGWSFDLDNDLRAYTAVPNCSAINIAFTVLGYEPPIVRGEIAPWYDLHGAFLEKKERMEVLQAAIQGKDIIKKPH